IEQHIVHFSFQFYNTFDLHRTHSSKSDAKKLLSDLLCSFLSRRRSARSLPVSLSHSRRSLSGSILGTSTVLLLSSKATNVKKEKAASVLPDSLVKSYFDILSMIVIELQPVCLMISSSISIFPILIVFKKSIESIDAVMSNLRHWRRALIGALSMTYSSSLPPNKVPCQF